jgi:hypothetical protein
MDDIQNIVEHYVNQLSSGDFEDAWQSLVELGPSALPYVVRAFGQSGDDKVSILLIRVVNEYRTSEALSFLANLLKPDRPEIWKTALDGFVAIADEDASATLHETAKALSADKQAWITEASDQIGKRRRILSELMRKWEQRFPDLAGEWTHWWIEGDGGLLQIVPGDDLLGAVRVIRDNHQRFTAIHAHRARIDSDGLPFRQVARFEIANRVNDSELS